MKKYYLIFKLTFIFDVLFAFAWLDFSAALWADWAVILCIPALIYQLVYLFILRKKDNKKFFEILLMIILFFITSLSVFLFTCCVDTYINGYTPHDILGHKTGDTIYGMQAISRSLECVLAIAYMIANALILIIYHFIVILLKKRKARSVDNGNGKRIRKG
ncbi:MAG: hypothetical protein IKU25_06435 [Clostridia bacterium]|nr:hypothetical protein [Clostridia bacterium]